MISSPKLELQNPGSQIRTWVRMYSRNIFRKLSSRNHHIDHHLANMWLTCGYHLATTWLPLGYYLATTWLPLGYQLATTWLPFGYHLAITWLPLGSHSALDYHFLITTGKRCKNKKLLPPLARPPCTIKYLAPSMRHASWGSTVK